MTDRRANGMRRKSTMLQRLLNAAARSYIRAELPKWGALFNAVVGTRLDDPRWHTAPVVTDRNKLFGYESRFDLSKLGDRGLYFLGRWADLPTQLMLTCFPRGTVVDVGANRGDFALAASYLCERVICFEPNPEMAKFLAGDLGRNHLQNVVLHECGLSDEPGTLTLRIPEFGPAGASFGGSDGICMDGLPVRVGDGMLVGEDPVLIKIDVEGFETRVIRGLTRTIMRARPVIITEVLPELLERCGSSEAELSGLMNDLGYCGFGIDTARAGLTHKLVLGVPSTDVAWLPKERRPEEFRATKADLRRLGKTRRRQS
jgi:FkbM family methyltransferase